MKEIYKDIPGFENKYQVSNLGNVRSLINTKGNVREVPKILKLGNIKGYLYCTLYKNNKKKNYFIHQLVAITFLNHQPDGYNVVVNHIDNNPLNNRVDNLELVTNRYNTSCHKTDVGVTWHKQKNKWRTMISIDYINIHLGLFTEKEKALEMYQRALSNVHLYNGDKKEFRELLRQSDVPVI